MLLYLNTNLKCNYSTYVNVTRLLFLRYKSKFINIIFECYQASAAPFKRGPSDIGEKMLHLNVLYTLNEWHHYRYNFNVWYSD